MQDTLKHVGTDAGGVGVNWKGPCGDQSAGASQKKRNAVVRTESVETKEYESCQQNDVEVDRDESLKKLSFVPGAVSDSAGWREPLTGSPYKKELELLRVSRDMRLDGTLIRQAMKAGRATMAEHCAADSSEEHGFPEAGHRASWWAGSCYIVARVSLL